MFNRPVYIYNDWHNGDVITNRALIREVSRSGLEIMVGSYRNRYYLVADLPVQHIVVGIDERSPHSLSLLHACPDNCVPINTWCGTFKDIDERFHHSWEAIVHTWNRQSESNGINYYLSDRFIPMIDFHYVCRLKTRSRSIFIENGPVLSGHCNYHFDMIELSRLFPDFTFYCTSDVFPKLDNVISCSNRNLVELSFISNSCEAIIGKGSGPFLATYTECNRFKPRAVVDFIGSFPFWNYPNNPLRNLSGDIELYEFITALRENPSELI